MTRYIFGTLIMQKFPIDQLADDFSFLSYLKSFALCSLTDHNEVIPFRTRLRLRLNLETYY